MPQSLAKIYIHLVFSTKNRERVIPDDILPDLHSYMGGILNGLGCVPLGINSEHDHIHILFVISRTETVSNIVGQLKKSSNDWLRAKDARFANFHWQAGYGAFSVSQPGVDEVRDYIRRQREHRQRKTSKKNTEPFSRSMVSSLMNAKCGIEDSTAPSGRTASLVRSTQGVAQSAQPWPGFWWLFKPRGYVLGT